MRLIIFENNKVYDFNNNWVYNNKQMNISLFPSFTAIAKNILSEAILQLNRNGRIPKKSNHGARPCSSVMRR